MSAKSVKGVRKLERPRPLRLNSDQDKSPSTILSPIEAFPSQGDATNDEDVMDTLERLHISVNNGNLDGSTRSQIVRVCNLLKSKGALIESSFREELDCYFVTLRNASRDEKLDVTSRLRLLEVIELRASNWKCNENRTEYYRNKFLELERLPQGYDFAPLSNSSSTLSAMSSMSYVPQLTQQVPVSSEVSPPLSLQPTEVLKSSGKFGKPAKIPGRNFMKDEIVIRNSDSGKVNPGVRDRLVQITGPNEETILRAKELIEDTIRRNASPIRDVGDEVAANYGMMGKEGQSNLAQKPSLVHSYSMGDASMGEYTSSIAVGRDILRISGTKAALVKNAKSVLEKFLVEQFDYTEKITAEMLSPTSQHSYVSLEPVALSTSRAVSEVGRDLSLWHGMSSRRCSGPPSSHTSSSSDEETFKEDNGNLLDKRMPPKEGVTRSTSIMKNMAAQQAGPVVEPTVMSKLYRKPGSSPDFTAPKAARPPVPSSASQEISETPVSAGSKLGSYSREFLLECSQSSYATQMPPDFPSLDPEVASLMIRRHTTPFDVDGFRQWMMRQASVSDFVSSPPISSTPSRSDLSEMDDGSIA